MKKAIDYFLEFSAIPHPSRHEAKLREHIEKLATDNGLITKRDSYGNLLIIRPAAPGYENKPTLIMQAHLDMVPEQVAGGTFDFLTQGIPIVETDGFLHSSAGTTLGADDAAGLAEAMEILLDKELKCGELRGLFTVEEEIGLIGASHLDPEFLNADYLVGLDAHDEGVFTIGCAGGSGTKTEFAIEYEDTPAGWVGVEIALTDLPGGHSGNDIAKNRPNAILAILDDIDFAVSSMEGGMAGNAIPRNMVVVGAISPDKLGGRKQVATPAKIWKQDFQERVITALKTLPNGVIEDAPELGVPGLSSNLGIIRTGNGILSLSSSQRSAVSEKKFQLSQKIKKHFESFGGTTSVRDGYCAWEADWDAEFLKKAQKAYRDEFGADAKIQVVHSGLEPGVFTGKNPKLQCLSTGPNIYDLHSPSERMEKESMFRIMRFLRRLLSEIYN